MFDKVYFEVLITADEHIPILLQLPNADEIFIAASQSQTICDEIDATSLI